ncbi:23S rRNA (uracil(1939)-C(5))-methyltransferase RlmD [Clostridiales bacterium F-3ap]|uniref:23S rRNA (Uracil(1939)-C(5))-methyltransferase RlmD n=1 Tax=Anaerotalea alkaliphila TaxID=2662126 RepID=A0A7X5HUA0_9FIRM|nr:23S rRNA (uracil(1939)-C(5))-methyltransferase RlmD [Anaerotalea alkaliphila]
MPVVKNEDYMMDVEDLGVNGEGIGKILGYTVFVDGALPGDRVRVKVIKTKGNYGYGKLLDIAMPSPQRVEPPCRIAMQCGGCQIQHLSYQGQLAYKQAHVGNCFRRIAGMEEVPMAPILGMEDPFHYRNKVQFPVREVQGRIAIGFYAARSHRVVETDVCHIQDRFNEEIIRRVRKFMEENRVRAYDEERHKGLVRHVLTRKSHHSGEFHVTLVINGKSLPQAEALVVAFGDLPRVTGISLNFNEEKTNVILGRRTQILFGEPYLEDRIGDVRFMISPNSFYQVNPVQTKVLYEKALEYAGLTGSETVWDIYCGIGTISLFLAQKAKQVYGVEVVESAIQDARRNAEANGMKNVEFFVGEAEQVLPEKFAKEGIRADVIVVDPPRKGCDPAVIGTILEMGPARVVYVSCDPATLARDVKLLAEGGYRLEEVQPVDMFPHSVHVETVVLLSRV